MHVCEDVATAPKTVRAIRLKTNCVNLSHLVKLRHLRQIHCDLVPDSLPYLAELPKLESAQFRLPRTEKIPSLAGLVRLRALVLRCTKDQKSLRFLSGLDHLESLCVSEPTSVRSLAPIGSLTELRQLYIDGAMHGRHTKVRTLAPIAKLTKLRHATLLLRSEQEHRPLRHLSKLRELEYLFLDHSFNDADELDRVVAQHDRLDFIEFSGGYRWPNIAEQ